MCLVDLGAALRLFRAWQAAMPRVAPYYAVKCNNDPALLALLAALGAGFDCASDAEVCPCTQMIGNACQNVPGHSRNTTVFERNVGVVLIRAFAVSRQQALVAIKQLHLGHVLYDCCCSVLVVYKGGSGSASAVGWRGRSVCCRLSVTPAFS